MVVTRALLMKIYTLVIFLFVSVCYVDQSHASQTFVVLDDKGKRLSNIIVEINASMSIEDKPARKSPTLPNEIKSPIKMKQEGQQFTPHILLVSTGQEVVFPNDDNVFHHVYSFSPAKTFEVTLEQNVTSEPIVFEQAGIVELGCNVHDWMLGYIYVSDAEISGQSALNGEVSFDLPPGEYSVSVWHPRISKEDIQTHHKVVIDDIAEGVSKLHKIELKLPLYPSLTGYDSVEATDAY